MSDDLKQRLAGAVWGQLCADAASLGTHWIYDQKEIERRYPAGIEGFEAPIEGHYHYGKAPGQQTHYGDAALVLLESLAECGHFDAVDFGTRFVALFGSPSYTGYRDHATRATLSHFRQFEKEHPGEPYAFQEGADDDEGATATRLAAVVARYWNDPALPETVRRVTLVTQNNSRAVDYMQCNAQILAAIFAGQSLEAALETARQASASSEVQGKIGSGLALKGMAARSAVEELGASCPLAKSFPAAIQVAVTHARDYRLAVLETLRAGGDSANRAAMTGAWLGASLGVEAIPREWRERLSARLQVERSLAKMLGDRRD